MAGELHVEEAEPPPWMTDTRCLALIVAGMAALAPNPARAVLLGAIGAVLPGYAAGVLARDRGR